jgi:hypothetical protein
MFWQEHYSNIIVQRPTADICDDCYVFYNKVKYNTHRSTPHPDDVIDDDGDDRDGQDGVLTEVEEYLKSKTGGVIATTKTGITVYDRKKKGSVRDPELDL